MSRAPLHHTRHQSPNGLVYDLERYGENWHWVAFEPSDRPEDMGLRVVAHGTLAVADAATIGAALDWVLENGGKHVG